MRKSAWLIAIALLSGACSHNPYLDASLTRYQGKDRAWIEKELGAPDAKTSRFFGGEKWTYNPVSYTHLDVYKRQVVKRARALSCETTTCIMGTTGASLA